MLKKWIPSILFSLAFVVLTITVMPVQASVLDEVQSAVDIEVGKSYDAIIEERGGTKWFKLVTEEEYKTYAISFPSTGDVSVSLCDANFAEIKRQTSYPNEVLYFNPGINETYYIKLVRPYNGSSETLLTVTSTEDEPNIMDDSQSIELGELMDATVASEVDNDWYEFSTGDYEENYTFYTTVANEGTYTMGVYDSNRKELAEVTCSSSGGYIYNRDYTNTLRLDRNETYYLRFSASKACEYIFKVTKIAAESIPDKMELKLTEKGKGFSASWNSVSTANGYEHRYSTDSSFKNSKKITTAKKNKKIGELSAGKTYYVKVRAYAKNSEGKKIYSKWSGVKTIKK